MMPAMLLARDLDPVDLKGLPAGAAALIEQLQQRLVAQQQELERKQDLITRQAREIAWRDAKLEKVNFELARLKRWKFGASSEAMNAQQRALFEETLAEDEASLQAQLTALQASVPDTPDKSKAPPRKPRRQALPEHLRRVEHHHEPESSECGCGTAMVRVGEDVSEKLDIIPAEFFVHRHIYGKWACRSCQKLVQVSAKAEIIDGGIPASGLVAHTLISRFVDYLPYYRQEAINARSGVHTPRSNPGGLGRASWGRAGAAVRGAQALRAASAGAARRRNARGNARSRLGQDQARLRMGLRARRIRCAARGGLRVLPGPRIAVPGSLPRRQRATST
jgi:transposase